MAESKKHSSSNGTRSTFSSSAGSGSSYSIADEIFGRKDSSSPSARSSSGYFSSVFPSTTSVMGNELSQSDFYWTLNKNMTDGQAGNNAHNFAAGNKSQGSPTKRQPAYSKDGKLVYPNEAMESTYFSSSVHYGGRDFYPSSSSSQQASENPKNYKNDKNDDYDNANAATRGEWWQGSLYY